MSDSKVNEGGADERGRPGFQGSTTEGLPVAPSLEPVLEQVHIQARPALMDKRALMIVVMSIVLGLAGGAIAEILRRLIALVTNLAFYGRISMVNVLPADAVPHLHYWVIVIPVIGGVIVGLMARYGSRAIRGHGIPEAMEQVLTNESRIPMRLTWLKPVSSAIAIGTGGPFGAEGPIIATGGALGSLIGQVFSTTSDERKTLLAAGAAAGMAATFGSPVSAVLLAIELLLFEFRPRSLIPVALAAATATGVRVATEGAAPVFAIAGALPVPTSGALASYILIGGVVGLFAILVTRAAYFVEDLFEHLPIHWMWWPAIGGIAVGVIGLLAPLTLGVGYSNITNILGVQWSLGFIGALILAKFLSWAIALGSGTSGGTLAPLFTIGGGVGVLLGAAVHLAAPQVAIDLRVAALVGMAAIFAGASRALLASVVFAFETTLQPMGLLPLLGGCAMSYLVSCVLMRNTIMTEKIARRGVRVPAEYMSDFLDQVLVRDAAAKNIIALPADKSVAETSRLAGLGGGCRAAPGIPRGERGREARRHPDAARSRGCEARTRGACGIDSAPASRRRVRRLFAARGCRSHGAARHRPPAGYQPHGAGKACRDDHALGSIEGASTADQRERGERAANGHHSIFWDEADMNLQPCAPR